MIKNKILIVGPINKKNFDIYGGTLTSIRLLLKSELSKKYQILVIDICPKSIPPANIFIRIPSLSKRFFHFLYICILNKPCAILFFFGNNTSFIEKAVMNIIAKLIGIKTIMLPRANMFIKWCKENFVNKYLASFFLKSSNKIICQGSEMQCYLSTLIKNEKEKIVILDNWTLTNEISEIGRKKVVLNKPHNKKFLFMGWLIREKGIYELINAFIQLSKEVVGVELYIAGDGPEFNFLEKIIKEEDIQDKCKLIGWVDSNTKLKLLETCDSFVLPSYSEGFPNVIIEALGARLSVISTKVGSIPSQLVSNKDFISISIKDENKIYSAMKMLIEDDQLNKKISNNGFNKAFEKYSLNKGSSKLINIIENI